MLPEALLKELAVKTTSKVVLLVIDGLGGLPRWGKTELEVAHKPNLDALAKEGICGLMDPIYPGITPGSGPGHLALFGYDPIKYQVKRGGIEALGLEVEVLPGEVVARGNFATLSEEGVVLDRRAGRIPSERNAELCEELNARLGDIEGVKVRFFPGKEHRFVVKFSGQGLSDEVTDTDPQKEGLKPLDPHPLSEKAEGMVKVLKAFLLRVHEILKDKKPANGILLRGFSEIPYIPTLPELYKLTPLCIATYPMYKGLARLVGMEVVQGCESIADVFEALKGNFTKEYDFFYLHIKATDSRGEDGDFEGKVKVIEEVDRYIPLLRELSPEVIVVTGDHSTPALLKGHSWHPVPFLLRSPYERTDDVERFTERDCLRGGLGRFRAQEAMTLMLASALKLKKFGA